MESRWDSKTTSADAGRTGRGFRTLFAAIGCGKIKSGKRMLFYKYQKSRNLDFSMLRQGEVYFASAGELNDASECRPRFIFKGSEELWQRLAQFILERACFGSDYFLNLEDKKNEIRQILDLSTVIGQQLKKQARHKDLGIERLAPAFRNALNSCGAKKLSPFLLSTTRHLTHNFIQNGLPQILLDEKYIASFALNATNPTMWGHYADAEKGFIRVFETDNNKVKLLSHINILHGERPSKQGDGVIEIGIYKDEDLELNRVQYGKEIPKVNAFHRLIHKFSYTEMEDHYDVPLNLGGEAEQKKEHLIGLVKYSGWRYEKEVRAFFPAYELLLPDVRILQVGMENIKGLIFGPKMTLENRARAVLCCHLMKQSRSSEAGANYEFTFFEAQQAVDKFDFVIRPVGILAGNYPGRFLPLKPVSELDETIVTRLHTTADLIAAHSRFSKSHS